MEKETYLLTTEDNPYSPFTQWSEWLLYDQNQGYNTCERLASVAKTSSILPYEVNKGDIDAAMDYLIEFGAVNRNGMIVKYKKVKSSDYNKDGETRTL